MAITFSDFTDRPPQLHRGWRATLALAIMAGLAVVGIYTNASPVGSPGVALLVSGGCLLLGGLLGFLFAIPKALQGPTTSRASSPSPGGEAIGENVTQSPYRANTNLEEVSDWLTKILVGVGLTQLTQLRSQARTFGEFFGIGFGNGPLGERLAVAALLYFSVAGFLFGYLWTRLFLGGALAEADALARVEKKLDEQQRQAQLDAAALSLVGQQMSTASKSGTATRTIAPAQLKDALAAASEPIRVQVFYQAEGIRGDNWRDPSTKPLMERTIPIFQALADVDVEDRFHRTWGQLGYALKDQRVPDLLGAEKALSKAIAIRGDVKKYGYSLYEFNRAVCRINSDPNFKVQKATDPERQKAIRADLQVAMENDLSELVEGTPEIAEWNALNS